MQISFINRKIEMINKIMIFSHLRFRSPWQSLKLMIARRVLRVLLAGRSSNQHPRCVVLPGDVVSEEILVSGLYEEALLVPLFEGILANHVQDFREQIALDIGANLGNHSLFFSRRFSRVLAFEPNPDALAILRCNVALALPIDNIEIIPVGLGNNNGEFIFHQNLQGNLGGSGFGFAGIINGREVICPLRRGDDLLTPKLLTSKVGLVKLDVEGSELAVLMGLEKMLRRDLPIVLFESNHSDGPQGGEATMGWLRNVGYSIFASLEETGAALPGWHRLIRRLWLGELIEARSIDRLQNRSYSMLVALPPSHS